MRYIYAVAGLILIIVGLSGITFLKVSPPQSEELARINGRVITADEFNKLYEESRAAPFYKDRRQFLGDLVTKEILIQEAKKRGLDLKEPFRRSIQNYYEQTLLKNLTQERMSEIHVSVSEDEIDRYYNNMGKTYELSIVVLPTEADAYEAIRAFPAGNAQRRKLPMEDVPSSLVGELYTLRKGEVSKKPVPCAGSFVCASGFLVFRLESYTTEPSPPLATVHGEIERTLADWKKRAEMEKWFEGLKAKSKITINEQLFK